ncbi:MAG: hypothetical protein Q9191_006646, partial [Dirinaria sp. TL-2023a]
FVEIYNGAEQLISYCVQCESAAFVHLMLQKLGSKGKDWRDIKGWKLIDYAIIRQDPTILAEFDEFRSGDIAPDRSTPIDRADHALKSVILFGSTILSSIGHAPLAILMARSEKATEMQRGRNSLLLHHDSLSSMRTSEEN